jgi:hypothetical protein
MRDAVNAERSRARTILQPFELKIKDIATPIGAESLIPVPAASHAPIAEDRARAATTRGMASATRTRPRR